MKTKSTILSLLSALVLAGCSFPSAPGSSIDTGSHSSAPTEPGTVPCEEPSSVPSSESVSISVPSEATSSSVDLNGYTGVVCLSDGGSTFEGSGIAVNGSTITISQGGSYLIQGTLSDGSIIVTSDDDVELDLNGVSITATTSLTAPIYSKNKAKLKVKKLKNTANIIVDSRTSYDSVNNEDTAAIFSNKRLSIVGSGSLSVTGNFKNGIASDTHVDAKNGILSVTSLNNAVKAHKTITLGDEADQGQFIIKSTAADGIHVDEDCTSSLEAGEFAGVLIQKGTYQIEAADDCVNSASNIFIVDGEGAMNATGSDGSKGMVSTLKTDITGGSFSVTSKSDDGIHSDGSISISGGSYTISSGDDGVHAENELTVSGGTIDVVKSYEGLEATYVSITGGTTYIKSSDDGINAAGGNDSSSTDWRSRSTASTDAWIAISGGYIFVAASGDGIDSNGNIIVTGGFTVVSQSGGGNGPLDYGDGANCYMSQSGGFLAAYGSKDMAVGASQGDQYSLLSTFNTSVATNKYMVVTNGDVSYAIKPQFAAATSLYVSCPGFSAGAVTLTATSTITNGEEIFKGVYENFTSGTTSSLYSGTFSSSNVHIGSSGNSGGHNPPGGGGPRW